MKNEFGLSEKSFELIKETLTRFDEVHEAIIFGSRAMGNYKKGSDVDIALKGNLKEDTLLKISVILDQELPLPYFFDIVDYDSLANQGLKTHIDEDGILFFSR